VRRTRIVNLSPFFRSRPVVQPVSSDTVRKGLRACGILLLGVAAVLCGSASAQSSSSSSSSSSPATAPAPATASRQTDLLNPTNRPQAAKIERGGAAVTLETSEPLFQIAAALNACGYDADLDKSAPVRAAVRADMNAALAASETARDSRDQLCAYISKHHLNDMGLDVGQYVSLALYLSPPPELTPNVDLTQLPPQAAAVVNVLPLLRTFADDIELHYLWLKHRPEYEALTARVHDPMTDMILDTNLYLHQPVSTFSGRRFLVLLEPMLSPNLTNARVYGSDYIIVMSPDNSTTGDPVSMAQIRHIYLHYVVEPYVYSRGAAMERMQPLLQTVQEAPLEFFYKSDIVALMSECVIKAIEAHLYTIADPAPKKLRGTRSREEDVNYDVEKAAYDAKTNVARDNLVTLDQRQGWVLTRYFYQGLTNMQHNGDGLRDEMAPMIYGMDVQREKKAAQQILFVKSIPPDPLRQEVQPHTIEGMELAELDLLKGNKDDAADIAEKALADPAGDHADATYVLARIDLMDGDPEKASKGFEQTLAMSKDPRTVAWSHIYLGRLYDTMDPPDRTKAVAEYKAALVTRDSLPDTKQAAQSGIAKPFLLPQRDKPADDDQPFDPTGKAEKDSYKPPAPH
jgi:tetratricopeptide (TPR) repeat protein